MVCRCYISTAVARSKGARANTLERPAVSLVPTIQILHLCGEDAFFNWTEMSLTRVSHSMCSFQSGGSESGLD